MYSSRLRVASGCTLALGLAVSYAPTVSAQTTTASGDSSQSVPYVQLQEVVVTARKVKENLEDIPVSVTAVTSQQITDHGLTDINDLARFVPGMSFEEQFGRLDTVSNTVIRGISSISNAPLSFKPFANFIDGVYVRGSLDDFDLSDVERVEVLRGPQSALYGRATESGLVNYITRQPTSKLEGYVDASVGQYGYQRYTGDLSGPLVGDVLFFSVNGNFYRRDGEYLNLYDNRRDDSQRTAAGSVSLRFAPTDDYDAVLRYGYIRDDDGPNAEGYQGVAADNCFLGVYPYYCGTIHPTGTVDLLTNPAIQPYNGLTSSTDRMSLRQAYRFAGYTLSSITGYDNIHQKLGLDQSYSAFLFSPSSGLPADAFQSAQNFDSHSVSEELRLASPRAAPLRYQVGASWYYETDATSDVEPADYDLLVYGDLNHSVSAVHNTAVFGQAEYDFTKKLTLSAELRLQEDDISYHEPISNYLDLTTFTSLGPVDYKEHATYDSANPRVVLDYKLARDVMSYVSISKGNKPGGFNSFVPNDTPGTPGYVPEAFAEEKLWEGEIGVKSELLNRRLMVNADIYYGKLNDLQVTQTAIVNGTPDSFDTNAGRAHTMGFELESQARVTDLLSLRATYSWNEAVFDDFPGFQDLCYLSGNFDPGCVNTPTANARGKTLPNAPRNMASLQADLTVPVGSVSLFVRPQYSYKSNVWDEAENLAGTGSQSLLDARLGVETGRWSVTLWGTNLLNNMQPYNILRYVDPVTFFYRTFAYQLPDKRALGVEARVSF